MHRRNPGMRVKVELPLKLSIADAEYLEETYGGEYRGYGTWIFSRVTEESWRDFESDLAKMRGKVTQVLKGNPLGEMLVVAGANPRKHSFVKEDMIQKLIKMRTKNWRENPEDALEALVGVYEDELRGFNRKDLLEEYKSNFGLD